MTKALISIDYTNDFVADDGKLTAGKAAQRIMPQMTQATKVAQKNGDFVFFAIDGHQLNDNYHPESKLFPPHNLMKTAGRDLYGSLGELYAQIKDKPNVKWLDKRHYNAFCGTSLDVYLRERHVDEVVLCGVLTDICVLHTAIAAYDLGYKITVLSDATASLTPAAHAFALNHFQNVLGANVITTAEFNQK